MIGETISHYQIVRKLGEGGMGAVYEAKDSRLSRHVALKFLPEAMVENPQGLARFECEARTISSLNHPHICILYDIGEHEGKPFLVMERLEGRSLQERLTEGPLGTEEILNDNPVPLTQLDTARPEGQRRTVDKCLEKDLDLRCQSAQELIADLKRVRRDVSSGVSALGLTVEPAAAAGPTRSGKRLPWLLAAVAVAALAAMAWHWLPRRMETTSPESSSPIFVPFTADGGWKATPSLSPDGETLYYAKTHGPKSLWSVPVAGGEESEVIAGPLPWFWDWDVSPSGLYFFQQTTSSELNSYAYGYRGSFALYFRDLSSGETTRLLSREGITAAMAPTVSPDEKRMVHVEIPVPEAELVLVEGFQ